jgi:hypothetical protein
MVRTAATLVVPAALALAASVFVSSVQGAASTVTTIEVLSVVQTAGALKDVAPRGFSAGDQFLVRDRLFNLVPQFGRARGAVVGNDAAVMTILQGGRSGSYSGVAQLVDGSIAIKGVAPIDARTATMTVVGGTGRYARARGTVVIRYAGKAGRATNQFRLTLP